LHDLKMKDRRNRWPLWAVCLVLSQGWRLLAQSGTDPLITVQPASQNREAGENATLSVTATGTALAYQWWKDGGALLDATNAALSLTNLQGSDAAVYSVVVSGAYGSVTSAVAFLTVNLAKLDPLFQVDVMNGTSDGYIYTLAVQADGKALVGGKFNTVGGQPCTNFGQLNLDGTVDSGFGAGADSSVYTVSSQSDGKIVLGGKFSTIGGQAHTNIARLKADGTLDSAFSAQGSLEVDSLITQADGKILVGGKSIISIPDGTVRPLPVRLNPDGKLDLGFNPQVSGWVAAVALQPDGKIVIGGNFVTTGGPARTNLARLNADGTLDDTFQATADGFVYALAIQSDGKILLVGSFGNLNGLSRSGIGRLNPDGTLDEDFNPGVNSFSRRSACCLALQTDGKILVGGGITALGGPPRSGIGRLFADGRPDLQFRPTNDFVVYTMAIQADGDLLVGGGSSVSYGEPGKSLGRVKNTEPATQSLVCDGTTITWLRGGTSPEVWRTEFAYTTNGIDWMDLGAGQRVAGGWQLGGLALPPGGTVRARGHTTGGQYNGSAYFFETMVGPPVFLSLASSRTNDFGSTTTFTATIAGVGPINCQWWKDGVAVGQATNTTLMLTNVSGADVGNYTVVLFNAAGSVTSTVATLTVNDPLITVQPSGDILRLGQNATFTVTATGTSLAYQWWKDGAVLPGATNTSLTRTSLQEADAGLYSVLVNNRYGSVTSAAAVLTIYLPDLTTNSPVLDLGFDPNADDWVLSVGEQTDGRIVLGGYFSSLAGQPRSCLARLDPDGRLDAGLDLQTRGGPYDSHMRSLIIQPNAAIVLGGEFTTVAGQTRSNLARVNADGTLDQGFNSAVGGHSPFLDALALQPDGRIIAGGNFKEVAGQSRSNLARLNPDGTLDPGFRPEPDGWVQTLALQPDRKILVGGYFSMIAGQTQSLVARLNADGTLDATFRPAAGGTGVPGVFCLALQADGKILVGGSFANLAGQVRNNLGRLKTDGTLDAAFDPAVGPGNLLPAVCSLALQADGKILVGGTFTNLAGQTKQCIARLAPDGSLDAYFDAPARGGNLSLGVLSLAVQANGEILVGGSFANLCGIPRSRIARLENTGPATQSLTYNGSTITWLRGGTSPEVWRTTFEYTTNGVAWTGLGEGSRILHGWTLPGVSLPATGAVRARGFTTGGYCNGSSWFVESLLPLGPQTAPSILTSDSAFGVRSNGFGFNVSGVGGQVVVVDGSSNLLQWTALSTNTLGSSWFYYFSDPGWAGNPWRFYRARLWP
jgi:uncharacterized delta-60 repeat protein